jgi:hypothetical protein
MSTIAAGQLMEYAEKQALAATFLKTQSPATGSTFLHLLTNAASGSVDNTWVLISSATVYAATGYSPVTFGPTTPTSASPSVISNTSTLTFGPFTAGTGATVIWGALGDSATPGSANFICAFLLTSSRTPANGDSLQAAASAFTCQV